MPTARTVELAACHVFVTADDYASEARFDALLARVGRRLDHARHAVTAQLLGRVFDDRSDGRSQILARTSAGVRPGAAPRRRARRTRRFHSRIHDPRGPLIHRPQAV